MTAACSRPCEKSRQGHPGPRRADGLGRPVLGPGGPGTRPGRAEQLLAQIDHPKAQAAKLAKKFEGRR